MSLNIIALKPPPSRNYTVYVSAGDTYFSKDIESGSATGLVTLEFDEFYDNKYNAETTDYIVFYTDYSSDFPFSIEFKDSDKLID